ncbi:MAG: HlyD family efflux transporter periplasmic adaptor subunit [Clostridia bacterium]|nr:HlyD family efflux transporter periplasmic adaptor subunit [Clostridia bacterium]
MSKAKTPKRRGGLWRAIKKWVKRLILLTVLVAAGLFGAKAYIKSQAANQEKAEDYATAQVQRGSMTDTVYGTGTTSAKNQPNLLADADGTLTQLRVSVGDTVKEGDILAVLTNDDIDDTITDLEFALWDLDAQITDTAVGDRVRVVEAPAAGTVVAIYAKPKDDALAVFRREGSLAVISTDGRMKVEIASTSGKLNVALDEKVLVSGDDIYAQGTVVDLTRQGTAATITIKEDDLPLNKDFDEDGEIDVLFGRRVIVRNSAEEVIGESVLEANKPMYVSSFGGTIESVRTVVGKTVSRGQTMFRLSASPLTLTLENLRIQRENAAKELEEAKQQREDLIIVAPCDGTIASLEVEEGDEITSGTLIGSILHGEDMNLTVAVDELDVVDVEVGQPVTITIDALSDLSLSGEVYKIAPVGTSSGGVTTYNVELTFDATGSGVKSGMNATGEIQTAAVEETLYIPVEAIMTMNNRSYVMVADGGSTVLAEAFASQNAGGRGSRSGQRSQSGMQPGGQRAQGGKMPETGSAPDGMTPPAAAQSGAASGNLLDTVKTKAMDIVSGVKAWLYEGVETNNASTLTGSMVPVETGLQNDDYVEVLSGLSEGDVVLYTATEETSGFGMFGGMMGGGMMGGMGSRR